MVVALYLAVLWLAATALSAGGVNLEFVFADPLRAQLIGIALLTLPVVLFFALWEASNRRATPGKRALGVRVERVGGDRLSVSRSLLRSAVKFAPWELAHTAVWRVAGSGSESVPAAATAAFILVWLLVGLYLLMPILDPRRRTPYDRLAGTVVRQGRA